MKSAQLQRYLPAIIIVLGFFIRLVVSYLPFLSVDVNNYYIVGLIVRNQGNVYAQFHFYNYSPVWSYFVTALSYLYQLTQIPFPFLVRGFLSLADMLNAYLVYRIALQLEVKPLLALSLYSFNPAIILIVALQGQFDCLAVLPLLAAIVLNQKRPRLFRTWLLGTLSILIKQITLFGVLTLFVYAAKTRWRSIPMILASGLVFLASLLPFRTASENLLSNVFGYIGADGYFGLAQWLPAAFLLPLFLLVNSAIPYIARFVLKKDVMAALLLSFVTFVVFAPGFFAHYLYLPLLAGVFSNAIWYGVFLLVSFGFLADYYELASLKELVSLSWISAVLWFIFLLAADKWKNIFQKIIRKAAVLR